MKPPWQSICIWVDLNPVRSRMTETPETSDHTSVKKRIQAALNIKQSDYQKLQPEGLYPFVGKPRIDMPDGLPFKLSEYIELVDLTGRQLREGGTRSFASCNHDHWYNTSASMHVHAPLHPATATTGTTLVHPCTSTLLCILQPRY
ncbi:hypothetical protein MNBD_GAMMA08-2853 [hydrothermal vent metagenome]|uniref:Uncharacterized protein n=1 Tax=hydrothermal vent metagenome TaxID=652676 RepID=A0A3B0XMS5_9ZZZZ